MNNIVLIGMPTTGKSTISNLFSNQFKIIDVDLLLSEKINHSLQNFINIYGEKKFLIEEDNLLCSLEFNENTIISTGGSAIYCSNGMEYLKSKNCIFIYLKSPLLLIKERLDLSLNRGIIMNGNHSIESLYKERNSLYLHYADVVIDMNNKTPEDIYLQIKSLLPLNKS